MPEKADTYRVFISALDPSADAHCAGLINALKKSGYDIECVGVGGPKMAEAGCKLLQNTVAKAAMIYKAFTQVFAFYRLLRRITYYLKSNKVDLVIVCDSPSFNFHVAKAAKKVGIKTLFYVAPQLWAWAGWRIRKLRRRCDKLCCILPFEQDWFRQRGIEAVFVGNPLFDELQVARPKRQYSSLDMKNMKLAIMPGSRAAEINSLWLPMQHIALRLKEKYPAAEFVTVAVDAERERNLRETQVEGFKCQYSVGTVPKTAAEVDFAVVASGSATLQVAAAGCPMVIMYQSSRLLWYLVGSWLVKAKYLSLVNILADEELVPEYMPYFTSIEPIIKSIESLLADRSALDDTSKRLIELCTPLAEKKAGAEVADTVVRMLRSRLDD